VPPLRHGARLSTSARIADASVSSAAWSKASEPTNVTYPGFDRLAAWNEDEVKDTPYAKRVQEVQDNMWATPSVAALHADMARVQAIRAEAEPVVQPAAAFVPLNMAAIHADFAKTQSAEEDHIAAEERANTWAVPSVAALHADLDFLQTMMDETAPAAAPANPFAPRSVSALHEDLVVMEAIRADLDTIPELAGQMQASTMAFAPVSVSRVHEDFKTVQALIATI